MNNSYLDFNTVKFFRKNENTLDKCQEMNKCRKS